MRIIKERMLRAALCTCLLAAFLPTTALAASGESADAEQIVTAWEYMDPEEYLVLEEGSGTWVLPLGGASEDIRPTLDEIAEILPTAIEATLDGADGTQELALSGWTCADYPETEVPSGSYTFHTALPGGYRLADDAPELNVLVSFGDVMTLEVGETEEESASEGAEDTAELDEIGVSAGTAAEDNGTLLPALLGSLAVVVICDLVVAAVYRKKKRGK